MNKIIRIFSEKKDQFNIEANGLLHDLKENLRIKNLTKVRILNRYDIEGINQKEYILTKNTIFSEPPVDTLFEGNLKLKKNQRSLTVEYLPGQYDQRADSAVQSVQLITLGKKPLISAAKLYLFEGDVSDEDYLKIKEYLINPVDSREAPKEEPKSLKQKHKEPKPVKQVKDFILYSKKQLKEFRHSQGLAMNLNDLIFCQEHFKNQEQRDPYITEIKILDTYWSDHCRHTTFSTIINNVEIKKGVMNQPVTKAFHLYKDVKKNILKTERDLTLMNIATMSMKEMKKRGLLEDMEISGEVNACSIIRNIKVNNKDEEWLIMFKNETHNHPTEIEPYGGAATCLGGAIRDPLSGRAYVYQAMRVTGSGDPREEIKDTIKGKLPQRKITVEAAQGYSSYGNQIGLATGLVSEVYHRQYKAKRMEVGAVVGAVKKNNIKREEPLCGDIILLVGGKTGRDGIGGATGSSKEHTKESIITAGAEVQKGNPVEERKLQRLFRNPMVTKLIKKSNDFGAGGVSVAVGELAHGLDIFLDNIPKKYQGLNGTELALSESQERMAVVIKKSDLSKFVSLARKENLSAIHIATVTGSNRLKMFYNNNLIVDIDRGFLDTHGVPQETNLVVKTPDEDKNYFKDSLAKNLLSFKGALYDTLQDLNVCSQYGLVERFDSTVGKGSVFMPFGGKYQSSPMQNMVAKIPILDGETDFATIMSYGFYPHLSLWSPFHGALYAVISAVSKIVAGGADYRKIRLSLQEYFEKLKKDSKRWGKPFAALLGAYFALSQLGIAAIGGKDSMSGSFEDIDVPPTLIAFAIDIIEAKHAVSSDFKEDTCPVICVQVKRDKQEIPDFNKLGQSYSIIHSLISKNLILASSVVDPGGIGSTIAKMCFGNKTGFIINPKINLKKLFLPQPGSIILQLQKEVDLNKEFGKIDFQLVGNTQKGETIEFKNDSLRIDEVFEKWSTPLNKVFPVDINKQKEIPVKEFSYTKRNTKKPKYTYAKPKVLITAFPGTNCEEDTRKTFETFGAKATISLFGNLDSRLIIESLARLKKNIDQSQILVIPGGFSLGDEPEGSGKFICAVLNNPPIKDALLELLHHRDGLILGICNGFQALIKLGLVPFGDILDLKETSPTVTFNTIGRHISRCVNTKVTSVLSPWFRYYEVGDILTVPISHGEGRFIANQTLLNQLEKNGQITTQYCDLAGRSSNNSFINPNGSFMAIEGISSTDGRVMGKMAHPERLGHNLLKNIYGNKDLKIFKAGVDYFK